jgi:hypothetical protein
MKQSLTTAAALLFAGAISAHAQATSTVRIPVRKDVPPASATGTASGTLANPTASTMPADTLLGTDTLVTEWYRPTGTVCSTVDVNAARAVSIKSDKYDAATMISPDSAKVVALCAVPGQIGSGEMNLRDGRTEYAITIIPNGKKTHAKVVVDAQTGAVLSTKQMGGLRGLAGWARESMEHKQNKKPE